MSATLKPASLIAFLHGSIVLSTKSPTISSNLALVIFITKCLGPESSVVINGWLISVSVDVDNSIFAFSADSFNLCKAVTSFDKSIPWSFLNS